jgi:hypothetical protein
MVGCSKTGRNELLQRLSDRVGKRTVKHPLRRVVEQHDLLLVIHGDNGVHRRSDDPFKLHPLKLQLLLGPLATGDIQKRRPPLGAAPRLLVHRQALERDPARGAGPFPELHLTGLSRAGLHNLPTMPVERVRITRRNQFRE